jgi:hypothetical protein
MWAVYTKYALEIKKVWADGQIVGYRASPLAAIKLMTSLCMTYSGDEQRFMPGEDGVVDLGRIKLGVDARTMKGTPNAFQFFVLVFWFCFCFSEFFSFFSFVNILVGFWGWFFWLFFFVVFF